MFWKGITHELLWFLNGDTNIKYLVDNGVSIWNDNAYDYYASRGGIKSQEKFLESLGEMDSLSGCVLGDLGPVYGKQWRHWYVDEFVDLDQISQVVSSLKRNPMSRRHIVSAWNPGEIPEMALPPCHVLFQFYCREIPFEHRMEIACEMSEEFLGLNREQMDQRGVPKYYLDCQLYQRSADMFLGVPFNIASYGLLTHMIAKVTNMFPGTFIHTIGDAHIYLNHLEQVDLQLSREPRSEPTLKIVGDATRLEDIKFDDIILEGYNPHSSIRAQMSV